MPQETVVYRRIVRPRSVQFGFGTEGVIGAGSAKDTAKGIVAPLRRLDSHGLAHHWAAASEDLEVGHGAPAG